MKSLLSNIKPVLILAALICGKMNFQAAEPKAARSSIDYLEPKTLAGTIYADDSKSKILYTFQRSATNGGSIVTVARDYMLPGGNVAATEHVVYESGQLVSYELKELQSGVRASVFVRPDPKSSRGRQMVFKYTEGGATRTDTEKLQPDTLINDMVGPFITAHWHELTNGATVRLRMVAPARLETVGFKLVKESESTINGKPVVIIRMEAASVFITPFVDPLRFTLEKEGLHRVLQYSGRTTPMIQKKSHWEDLDAFTTFSWP